MTKSEMTKSEIKTQNRIHLFRPSGLVLVSALTLQLLFPAFPGKLSALAAPTETAASAGESSASEADASGTANAAWPVPSAAVEAEGAIVMDADSGTVLYGKNQDTAYYPASITKVLTAIVVLENCKNLDDKVTFSYDATATNLESNSTVIGAVAGDKLSVRDLLYCMLLHSANDCANALAEYIAGSNAAFAEMMNQKAAELGCTNSHFMNPSGLNNEQHYTTCSDYAKIMQYAIQNETFRQIDATQVYTHAPIDRYPDPNAPENTVYAHHRMMRKTYSDYYEGVFAGKTGYTILAGNTLATACTRNGMTLICIILNGHNSQYRDTRALFDFGFQNFDSLSVRQHDKNYSSLESHLTVDGIPIRSALSLSVSEDDHVTLPSGTGFSGLNSSLTYSLSEEEKAAGNIARVDYHYGDRLVGHAYVSLSDESSEREAALQDAAVMESKVQETVPETIQVSSTESTDPTVAGQLPAESSTNHAPVIFDREQGRVVIQKPILRVLAVLGVILAVVAVIGLFYYLLERREEFRRKRRRDRMLRHTKDLTRAQKARRDLLLSKRTSRRRR